MSIICDLLLTTKSGRTSEEGILYLFILLSVLCYGSVQ